MNKYTEVIEALSTIDKDIIQGVREVAKESKKDSLIKSFNQNVYYLFSTVNNLVQKIPANEQKNFSMGTYEAMLDTSIKVNYSIPIEQFCSGPLKWAGLIYTQKYAEFLDCEIDKNASIDINGKSFSLFDFEKFRVLWKQLNAEDQEKINDIIILLTSDAHAYFMKTIDEIMMKKQSKK
jgi:hypothetical protein